MYYTTDKLHLHYELQGKEKSSKCLLFLNGLSQSTTAWAALVPAFEKEYKIVLCDFILQGQSSKDSAHRNFEQHAADILGLIDHLGITKIILVGISYGSLVAQHFVLQYPSRVEKLILISTFAHKTPVYEAMERGFELLLHSSAFPLFSNLFPGQAELTSNPFFRMLQMPEARTNLNEESTALHKLMLATKYRPDYRENLKTIQCPTLVIHGEKDLLLSLDMAVAVAESIPGSKLEVIPGAGHTLNVEAASQLIRLIQSFLTPKMV